MASIMLAGIIMQASEQQTPPPEYQVKATFLFNFAKFSDWPTDSFKNAGDPFVIGILGNDPFGTFLDEIIQGESIQGHPIAVRRLTHLDQVADANLLFISQDYGSMRSILNLAREHHVMTVSDIDDFALRGGMIFFFTDQHKIKFEVNVKATKDAGVILSSKVLRLAKVCCQ